VTEITGLTSADAMTLLSHTLGQLEAHLDDPDGSNLSGQGMLQATRDRLSTLYALVVNLIQAPGDSRLTPAAPRCSDCSEPIVWSESRQNWTHRNFVAVPHAVTTRERTPEPAPAAESSRPAPRGKLEELAEELEELPEICRDLVGPRCGEAVDRARDARRLVRELRSDTPAPRWEDTRADDGRWLAGSDACPRGCSHVLMAHRSDVGCISCDCQHGISES
jgi:hypothetical protein